MQGLLFVAIGGALGAVARFLASEATVKLTGIAFPLGTILVNLTGCFLIGLLWGGLSVFEVGNNTRLLVFAGFLGAFTTFSTFALENVNLFRNGEVYSVILNILISNIAGIGLAFAGFYLSGHIIRYIFPHIKF